MLVTQQKGAMIMMTMILDCRKGLLKLLRCMWMWQMDTMSVRMVRVDATIYYVDRLDSMHSQSQNLKQQDGVGQGGYSDEVRYIINLNFNIALLLATNLLLTNLCSDFCKHHHIPLIYQPNDFNNKYNPFTLPMSAFRRLSLKKIVHQHCVEDAACLHHCQCWLLHQKQYDIKLANLMAKYDQAKKQLEFQTKLNVEMAKQLENFKKKAAKYKNIEAMKEDYRKELQEQIYRQREVQDTLTKQKLEEMESEIRRLTKDLQLIHRNYQQSEEKVKQLQTLLEQKQRINNLLGEQNEGLRQENEELGKKQEQYYNVIVSHENTIDEKTAVIEQLRKSINEIEGRFICEKAKASSFGTQKDILQINLKNKDKYIESLTKCSQENLKNLHNIQSNNQDLKNLIGTLDCQVMAGRMNELYFRDRLIQSEERLAASEGLAAYNSTKIQLMKNDLHLLKLTI